MITFVGWYLTIFGVWPLAHPEHTTYGSIMTWLDILLHCIGAAIIYMAFDRWFASWVKDRVYDALEWQEREKKGWAKRAWDDDPRP